MCGSKADDKGLSNLMRVALRQLADLSIIDPDLKICRASCVGAKLPKVSSDSGCQELGSRVTIGCFQ
jgi:hypothetical protein